MEQKLSLSEYIELLNSQPREIYPDRANHLGQDTYESLAKAGYKCVSVHKLFLDSNIVQVTLIFHKEE